jgi:hypothetical protein
MRKVDLFDALMSFGKHLPMLQVSGPKMEANVFCRLSIKSRQQRVL